MQSHHLGIDSFNIAYLVFYKLVLLSRAKEILIDKYMHGSIPEEKEDILRLVRVIVDLSQRSTLLLGKERG